MRRHRMGNSRISSEPWLAAALVTGLACCGAGGAAPVVRPNTPDQRPRAPDGGGQGGAAGNSCPSPRAWFPDRDGDGFGDERAGVMACQAPDQYVLAGGDCDDRDKDRRPEPARDPGFVLDRCGQGRLVEPMTDATAWLPFLSAADGS